MNAALATTNRLRPRFIRLVSLTVVLGLTIGFAVWIVGAVGKAREAARRTTCRGRFCQLKVALLNYHEIYGSFPPAYIAGPDGTPWHSWRTLLLPVVNQQKLYDQYRFDEPWNSPHNRQLAEQADVMQFQCPSSPGYGTTPFTNYVVVLGEGTLFPGPDSVSQERLDDPEQTILLVETDGLDIHWMEPRDLDVDTMSFDVNSGDAPSISSAHADGAHVIHAGSGCVTNFLTSAVTEAQLRQQFSTTKTAPD